MVPEWYYSQNGAKQGPITEAHLKQLAASGELRPADHVWKQGMADWLPASSVPGLVAAPSRPPVLPPAAPEEKHTQAIVEPQSALLMSERGTQAPPDQTVPGPRRKGWNPVAVVLISVGVVFVLFFVVCAGGAAIVVPLIFSVTDSARRDIAKAQIRGTLVPAVERYRTDQEYNPEGALPSSLDDLVNSPKAGLKADQLIDPWGQPFQFSEQSSHGNEYDVWSQGGGGRPVGNWKE
jgi:type II secretory pathway pseudopilin PulG